MTTETLIAAPLPFTGNLKQSLVKAALFVGLASLTLFPHFMMCAIFGPAGFVGIVGITLAAIAINLEFGFTVLIVCLFLQNLFIALVTPVVPTIDQFTPMLGTSFVNIVLTSAFCAAIWMHAKRFLPEESNRLMRMLLLFFVVIVIYSGIGAARSTPADAMIYARVYTVGGLLLITGVAFGLRLPASHTASIMRVLTFFLVAWGFLEFFSTYELYRTFNIPDYMRMKYATDIHSTFYSVEETINFASRSYLNLSGALGLNVDVLRPMGPNIHPISYAYALAFGALVCYVNRAPILLLGCLILLMLVGAKGPLIMGFLSVGLGYLYQAVRNQRFIGAALIVCMVLYTALGLIYGSYTEDYHVVGFWGGVKGFLSNPLGNGIGVGGNLSTLGSGKVNFSLFQGYGASFALESGFGVMLYQIGVCTAVFLLFYWRLWSCVWKAALSFANEPRLIAIPCALGILLVNSIFQEEAFSPAGWGPLMLLSGLLLAKYWQSLPSREAVAG